MKREFKSLINWSLETFHQLPWRIGRTPYTTLVSEMMLQQTTVSTVKTRYPLFLKKFPSLQHLAEASESDVLQAWEGLGYYRRARLLKSAAEHLCREFPQGIPEELNILQTIPGIGRYTAAALRSIGHNLPALSVDANLERVLARLLLLKTPKGPALQLKIHELFNDGKLAFLQQWQPRDLNEALMDLGREVCRAREAKCQVCPLQTACLAYAHGQQLTIPFEDKVKKKLRTKKNQVTLVRLIVCKQGKYLGEHRKKGTWLEGQWELPTFVVDAEKTISHQYNTWPDKDLPPNLPMVKSTITSHILTNHIYEMNEATWKIFSKKNKKLVGELRWHTGPWSSASKKCLAKVKKA
jgi:A/G-specific adenine glycosylase